MKLQRLLVEEIIDRADRAVGIWNEPMTLRYFIAGGGTATDFPSLWNDAMALRRRCVDAVRIKTFVCAGGALFYLASGRKPALSPP